MRNTPMSVVVLSSFGFFLSSATADAARRPAANAAFAATPTPAPATPAGDFDQDGNPDVLWYNAARGTLQVWLMGGFKPHDAVTLGATTGDPMLHAVGTADFNNDGMTDILLWNAHTGAIYIWYMRGLEVAAKVELDLRIADRFPVSVYDFDQDGSPDILWQNKGGDIIATIVRGGMIVGKFQIDVPATGPAELWMVRGSADFDGDGDHDLLVERSSEFGPASPDADRGNPVGVILMQKTTGTLVPVSVNGDQDFEIGAVADFDRDGDPDILFENDTTGAVAAWVMAGTKIQESVLVTQPGSIRAAYDMVGPR